MSLDLFTGTLKLFSPDIYCLLDSGFTLFFVTPYVAIYFVFDPKCILDPFSMSTPVGDSIMAIRFYRSL